MDDEALEALKDALIEAQHLAVDEAGKVLVWTGAAAAVPAAVSVPAQDRPPRQASPEAEPAADHYRQALALAEELGMRPLQAHCHRGLGTLYAKLGWQEQARAALATAIALYRTMDMTFWLPQAEAALAQAEER